MKKIKAGPLLGIESEILYTVCFSTDKDADNVVLMVDKKKIVCQKTGETPSSNVWKASFEIAVGAKEKRFTYHVLIDGEIAPCKNSRSEWTCFSPNTKSPPKFVYTSCNGFSSQDLMHKTQEPFKLWQQMVSEHDNEPISLLLMGGDQLYADEIWSAVPELKKWNKLSHKDKVRRTASKTLCAQVDRFYDKLYQECWVNKSMSLMLATVPSLMMWDDHEIFDGWGSFPADLQNCDVFQAIFKTAKRYFELFQIRSKENTSLLEKGANHYAFALKFRGYHILALDNRSERTLNQVMSHDGQWPLINDYLSKMKGNDHLLVMSAVPVVYRDFSFTESIFDFTPWEEELTDDLKDHWRSKEHHGERARLIHRLLENANRRCENNADCKTVILSGDVHLGCLGVINDQVNRCRIHQVVSSGIVHPTPSRLQWIGIMAVTNDKVEYLDENRDICISMLTPFSSDKYIRHRNYVSLSMGNDHKLWVNWACEGKDNPYYPIK